MDDVARRFPGNHYVLIDDKIRILTAAKKVWGGGLTTVFVRQGHYADASNVASYPPPDLTIDRIDELVDCDLAKFLAAAEKASRT